MTLVPRAVFPPCMTGHLLPVLMLISFMPILSMNSGLYQRDNRDKLRTEPVNCRFFS
jgi:hypothetical protein